MKLRIAFLLATLFSYSFLFSQTPCEAGLAGIYPCDNVDLLSIVPNSTWGGAETNDIWGWTDPLDGKEYVIMGLTDGTVFFDISDPVNPIYLGHLATQTSNSLWRDMKVYNNYAFIVSEAGGHGMQVFDLTKLRTVPAPPATFTVDAHYAGFGNAHNIAINEATATAYAVGTNTFSGGLHIIDISNPLVPTLAGDYALDGYTHDCQVVTYNGPDATYAGREMAFNCNEDYLTIADVNDPTDTQTISTVTYAQEGYTHQGWLTPDHRYFLLGDELDESNFGINTRTLIWDVQDLDAPVLIGQYYATTQAIDHNLYTDGNLTYQSNYRAGLRILDHQNVAAGTLSEVAYFDLYPSSNSAQFNGTWSNYPYFSSGVVAVSHIEGGLFLLNPQFLNADEQDDLICFTDDQVADVVIETGFVGPVNLTVASGLPGGATATFSANNVGPGAYTLTLSNLPAVAASYNIVVQGVGTHFTYTSQYSFSTYDCINDVLGCTDPAADNYNSLATIDDGSCTYPCSDVTFTLLTDCYPGETSWDLIQDATGTTIAAGSGYSQYETVTWNGCIDSGCYTLTVYDTYGDGLNGTAFACTADGDFSLVDDASGTTIFQMGDPDFDFQSVNNFCVPLNVDGCTDTTACNYNSAATVDDGSCLFNDACGVCGGAGTVAGCTDTTACNYNASADCDDGSCQFNDACGVCGGSGTVAGCTDTTACNYNASADCDDGSCLVDDACGVCGGAGTVAGCTDTTACNYNSLADCDDGSCAVNDACGVCGGAGTVAGCTDTTACNYNSLADCDDGSCAVDDACGVCGGAGTIAGCTNITACNYNPLADCDDGSCAVNDACGVCGGAGTLAGCTNLTACNYNPLADCDDGSCLVNDACGVCGGAGTIAGCTNIKACNYNPLADCDDGSCAMNDACGVCGGSGTTSGCTDTTACNYNPLADCDDGSCTSPDACGVCGGSGTVAGCTDTTACNYNPLADCDDGSCAMNDACGVCGGSGTTPGCTDTTACNYNPLADCDDGSCTSADACGVCGGSGTFAGCTDTTACNYNPLADCDDGSCAVNDACGICGGSGTTPGCTDTTACNYNPLADCDDGSCQILDACGVCGGAGTVAGCTDTTACNYNSLADCDDGSCVLPDGCMDTTACNYDSAAMCDDGSCEFASCACPGDFNGDGVRNTADLLALLEDFGCLTGTCPRDLTGDGITNSADILFFLTVFGVPCP